MLRAAEPALIAPRAARSGFNDWDALKLIGLALMFADHAGAFLFPEAQWLRALGRGAAPVFLFLAGLAGSYRVRADLIFLAALLTISNSYVAGGFAALNILASIILCRMLLVYMETRRIAVRRPARWFVALALLLPTTLLFHYGNMALMFALAGHLMKHRERYASSGAGRFLAASFAFYALIQGWLYHFSAVNWLLMLAVLYPLYRAMLALKLAPAGTSLHPALRLAGAWAARRSAYLYALHLLALQWLTLKPF